MTIEAERQFYLSQMGVHLWYARAPLPGAAPTPDLDFSEPVSERLASSAEVVRSQPAVKGRAPEDSAGSQGNVRDLLKSINAEPEERDKTPLPTSEQTLEARSGAGENVKPAVKASDDESVNISSDVLAGLGDVKLDIGFWLSERYCLMSSVSPDISEELQVQLATNILKALNAGLDEHKRFAWPVFNNPAVMKNARRDLSYLLRRIEKDIVGERTLICLGYVGESAEQHGHVVERLSKTVLQAEHPLSALAGDPGNKKHLWDMLKGQFSGEC
ncbi:hypothetical protein [Marinobacter fonticola]|uniref:hypothetical protein n=1 Tax=Marinobacter fonticola TaxID=2603215 RepID=UPI0011E778D5|nr:hypothetical protein [Marinobacter fonticola]